MHETDLLMCRIKEDDNFTCMWSLVLELIMHGYAMRYSSPMAVVRGIAYMIMCLWDFKTS